MRHRVIFAAAVVLALGYVWLRGGFVGAFERRAEQGSEASRSARASDPSGSARASRLRAEGASARLAEASTEAAATEKATFAAGCFWCVEADFDKVPGVISTTSGYTGGTLKDPSYEQVSRGGTGHTEAVEIVYDPSKVTYEQLLDHFWKNVDPLTANRQFCDVGDQYRPAIFFHGDAQRRAAEESKARVQRRFDQPVVVQIVAAAPFYRAESYHQDYYKRNPVQYRYYRWGCGRDRRLAELARKQSS